MTQDKKLITRRQALKHLGFGALAIAAGYILASFAMGGVLL